LLGRDRAERNFAVYPDDTFLVSYPRSGNTWTRFLIAHLVHPDKEVSFTNIEKLIPDTSSQSNLALKRTPRPRIIKTHEYFDHRYRKTIYIVRDPRDVVLSYYNFQRKYRQIADDYPLDSYVDDFVTGREFPGWGTWGENVASWIYTRGNAPNFLLLHYENMLKETAADLNRITAFLGIESDPERVRHAIERSSAERMRQLEKTEASEWIATKDRRKDIPFVGAARSGGWKSSLPESCVVRIESAWGELMSTLGYELTTPVLHRSN
jgi:hypothetical protein